MSKNNNRYITIMAGGVGSRFWPASTEDTPKQFLDILGVGKSLLRLTFERFLNLVPADRILIVTNKKYKALTQLHLPELPEENILCEPSRNNTAPCVAYTALRLRAENPDAVFVTAPSDHVILKEEAFLQKITEAYETYVKEHQAWESEKPIKAAASRARKALGELGKLTKERRKEIQERKNAL